MHHNNVNLIYSTQVSYRISSMVNHFGQSDINKHLLLAVWRVIWRRFQMVIGLKLVKVVIHCQAVNVVGLAWHEPYTLVLKRFSWTIP